MFYIVLAFFTFNLSVFAPQDAASDKNKNFCVPTQDASVVILQKRDGSISNKILVDNDKLLKNIPSDVLLIELECSREVFLKLNSNNLTGLKKLTIIYSELKTGDELKQSDTVPLSDVFSKASNVVRESLSIKGAKDFRKIYPLSGKFEFNNPINLFFDLEDYNDICLYGLKNVKQVSVILRSSIPPRLPPDSSYLCILEKPYEYQNFFGLDLFVTTFWINGGDDLNNFSKVKINADITRSEILPGVSSAADIRTTKDVTLDLNEKAFEPYKGSESVEKSKPFICYEILVKSVFCKK